MNYISIYCQLINRGKHRVKSSNDSLHCHRIIPGFLGGDYSNQNTTLLTKQEHRIVHKLRFKLFQHIKDRSAYRVLGGNAPPWNTGIKCPSISIAKKGKSVKKGYKRGPQSPEHRLKLSLAKLGKPQSKEHIERRAASHRGKKRTVEQRQRISQSLIGWNKRSKLRKLVI
jgi:hypothetical protein